MMTIKKIFCAALICSFATAQVRADDEVFVGFESGYENQTPAVQYAPAVTQAPTSVQSNGTVDTSSPDFAKAVLRGFIRGISPIFGNVLAGKLHSWTGGKSELNRAEELAEATAAAVLSTFTSTASKTFSAKTKAKMSNKLVNMDPANASTYRKNEAGYNLQKECYEIAQRTPQYLAARFVKRFVDFYPMINASMIERAIVLAMQFIAASVDLEAVIGKRENIGQGSMYDYTHASSFKPLRGIVAVALSCLTIYRTDAAKATGATAANLKQTYGLWNCLCDIAKTSMETNPSSEKTV